MTPPVVMVSLRSSILDVYPFKRSRQPMLTRSLRNPWSMHSSWDHMCGSLTSYTIHRPFPASILSQSLETHCFGARWDWMGRFHNRGTHFKDTGIVQNLAYRKDKGCRQKSTTWSKGIVLTFYQLTHIHNGNTGTLSYTTKMLLRQLFMKRQRYKMISWHNMLWETTGMVTLRR